MKVSYRYLLLVTLLITSASLFAQSRHKLHVPASLGNLAAVKKIIDKKPRKADKKDIANQTPLMYAAEGGSIEVVKYLIEKGADVNALSGKKGRGTPLIYATATNQVEIVTYLIEKNADVNLPNKSYNETALFWAVATGYLGLVELLLKNGADQKLTNKSGENVMDLAKRLGRVNIVQVLQAAR